MITAFKLVCIKISNIYIDKRSISIFNHASFIDLLFSKSY
jgi:1-acyl-sn-glycerol-3-phosphate acyltransferase